MPKMSDALSNRTIQPGTTNTGTDSETSLYAELIKFLPEDHWEVCDHPQELTKIFGTYGIVPDASIRNKKTGRIMYFETKYQGPKGNAEERAGKLFTHHFVNYLKSITGMPYHAYRLIMTGSLATDKSSLLRFFWLCPVS